MENKLSDNQHIWLLLRLQWSDNQFVTIGKLQKLNKEDLNYLIDYIIDNMANKSEYYRELAIKSMIFSYTIKKGRAKDKITFESTTSLQYQNFQHHKLPITMNPLNYGKLMKQRDNEFTVQVNKTNVAIITQEDNINLVEFFREGQLVYKYKDIFIDNTSFIRHLDNKQFTFKNNELILLTIDKSVKFIKGLLPRGSLSNKFLTMDLETLIKNGVHVPYAISWYNGENCNTHFIYKMSTQNQIIAFCILGAIAVPLGTFTAIKTIKKIWGPPLHILRRNTTDIELVDYIQPSRPGITYYPRELLDSQLYPTYERYSSAPTYYSEVNHSSILPSYHTVDNNIINCCLENENMNIFYYFIITIILTLYLLKKAKQQNLNLIPFSLVPFSFFEIDFRDSFEWQLNSYRDKPKISYLRIQTLTDDITNLLNSLNDDLNYSMSLSYISSYEIWKNNKEKVHPLFIDDAIIINKESDPILITQFIMNGIDNKGLLKSDWLDHYLINLMDPVILVVIIRIKVKI
jgi:hypothetical protein